MTAENRICQNCKNDFTIEPDDFGFYEKINVPPPTFCPDCRMQRRWAWRNNVSLYSRKCDLCAKSVVSIYSPESGITIYCNKCWWSDKWEPKSYGKDYDFSKPFFTQFQELIQQVPHMTIVNDNGIASVNCEYTHDWWFSKNCYMCFTGWHVENVMYTFFIVDGKNTVDCYVIMSPNDWIYECMLTRNSYQVKFSFNCIACIDSQFLFDCRNSQNCFMCTNLRVKNYCFKNKQYSKEEYEKILEGYRLDTFSGVEKAKKEFKPILETAIRQHMIGIHNKDVSGDGIGFSKNVRNSFFVKNAENVRHSQYSGDENEMVKDCYDITTTGGTSESYECVVGDHSQLNRFGLFSVKSQDIQYNHHCHNCKHIFGCVGLRNTNYAIFNKQYTKEEYEELVPKIIEHMNAMPYVDKTGKVYKYGEYFPAEHSYFGYNESCAMEQFPLSKDEALAQGYNWQDNIQKTIGKETLKLEEIPDAIEEVTDSILEEVLACMECGRNYKIVANELLFYRQMKIPIPRRCFHCRHKARAEKMNPFRTWHRQCMCEKGEHTHGEGRCEEEFETSYAPERPEIVYCEKCYQKEVY